MPKQYEITPTSVSITDTLVASQTIPYFQLKDSSGTLIFKIYSTGALKIGGDLEYTISGTVSTLSSDLSTLSSGLSTVSSGLSTLSSDLSNKLSLDGSSAMAGILNMAGNTINCNSGIIENCDSITSKVIINGVVNVGTISSGTYQIDCSLGNEFDIIVSNNLVLYYPINAVAGQLITIRLQQPGSGSYSWSLEAGNVFFAPGGISLVPSTGVNSVDIITMLYNAANGGIWQIIGFVRGDQDVTFAGNVIVNNNVTAAAFYGDGSHITGITAGSPGGSAGDLQINSGSNTFIGGGPSVSTITGTNTLTMPGNIVATGTIAALNLSGTNTGDQDLSAYALVAGQVFTGSISASNLSGTNTGDQDLTAYALVAGQVFSGSISASNLSGTNTGDQDLTAYAALSGATFTGQTGVSCSDAALTVNDPSGKFAYLTAGFYGAAFGFADSGFFLIGRITSLAADSQTTDIVVDSSGNIGLGLNSSLSPTAKIDMAGVVKVDVSGNVNANGYVNAASYSVGGTPGFNGSGTYTNFTIVNGIITAAS